MQLYYKMDRIMRLKFLRDLKMDKRDGPVSPNYLVTRQSNEGKGKILNKSP